MHRSCRVSQCRCYWRDSVRSPCSKSSWWDISMSRRRSRARTQVNIRPSTGTPPKHEHMALLTRTLSWSDSSLSLGCPPCQLDDSLRQVPEGNHKIKFGRAPDRHASKSQSAGPHTIHTPTTLPCMLLIVVPPPPQALLIVWNGACHRPARSMMFTRDFASQLMFPHWWNRQSRQ